MAIADMIVEIIFSSLLFCAQITLIVVHIFNNNKNRKIMNESKEISKNSFEIVENNYRASIRPDFQVITQSNGFTPIDMDPKYIDLQKKYNSLNMSIYPNWWGKYRFVYLKNVGNGPAFGIKLQNFYATEGETTTIPMIAQSCEFIVVYIPHSEISQPSFEKLTYLNSIVKLVGITDKYLEHGAKKLKISFEDRDGTNYSYQDIMNPY